MRAAGVNPSWCQEREVRLGQRRITIHTQVHIHTCGQFREANRPNQHVFGPHDRRAWDRKAPISHLGSNLEPSCCPNHCTIILQILFFFLNMTWANYHIRLMKFVLCSNKKQQVQQATCILSLALSASLLTHCSYIIYIPNILFIFFYDWKMSPK